MGTINDFETISMAPEILTAKDNFFVILGHLGPSQSTQKINILNK